MKIKNRGKYPIVPNNEHTLPTKFWYSTVLLIKDINILKIQYFKYISIEIEIELVFVKNVKSIGKQIFWWESQFLVVFPRIVVNFQTKKILADEGQCFGSLFHFILYRIFGYECWFKYLWSNEMDYWKKKKKKAWHQHFIYHRVLKIIEPTLSSTHRTEFLVRPETKTICDKSVRMAGRSAF